MRFGGIGTMLCVAAMAASFATHGQTNVYRWVDKDGKVHFSDSPPPQDAKESSNRMMGGGQPAAAQMPYETQQAMKKNPVVLYTSPECVELCAQGRALLGRRGVPFTERNAGASAADAEQVKKLIGSLEVPVLLVGEKHVKGYEEGLWQAALDRAGYARTALPGQANVVPPPAAIPAPAAPTTPTASPASAAPPAKDGEASPAPGSPASNANR
jgi:glutaredoxin